ncbi:6-phosphogluconolactonase [Propionibacteriaceae bacterium G1746]
MKTQIAPDAGAAGAAAGRAAVEVLRRVIGERGHARVIFASAPSQEGMLATLRASDLDFSAITALHMDEYLGISPDHPAGFGRWLADRLDPAVALHRLDSLAEPDAEVARYTGLIADGPVDLALVGIGVNGHIAFNEPHDPARPDELVREVDLTLASREQQVDDGCFATLAEVPRSALSLTPAALMAAHQVICTVLGRRKAAAVKDALTGPVGPACPASILQTHDNVLTVLDTEAAAQLGTTQLEGSRR